MHKALAALCGLLVIAGTTTVGAAQIEGDYIEARTADVFTGPCFSNAEVFITGHQAVMAWKVNQGEWNGVDLSGLNVAAAVLGSTTFSQDDPTQARSVMIVDRKATPAQREALIAMAKHLAGTRLDHVVAVKTTTMDLTVEDHHAAESHEGETHHMPQAPKASFWAAGLASILSRPLDHEDVFCGNEVIAYEPLSEGVQAKPAYTLSHSFKGKGLNTTWNDHNCRGTFVGHFAY